MRYVAVALAVVIVLIAAIWAIAVTRGGTKTVTGKVTFVSVTSGEWTPKSLGSETRTGKPQPIQISLLDAFIARTEYGDIVFIYACAPLPITPKLFINGMEAGRVLIYVPYHLPDSPFTCRNVPTLVGIVDGRAVVTTFTGIGMNTEEQKSAAWQFIAEHLQLDKRPGKRFEKLQPPVRIRLVWKGSEYEFTVEKIVEMKLVG